MRGRDGGKGRREKLVRKVSDRPEKTPDTFPQIPEAIKHKQCVQMCVRVCM